MHLHELNKLFWCQCKPWIVRLASELSSDSYWGEKAIPTHVILLLFSSDPKECSTIKVTLYLRALELAIPSTEWVSTKPFKLSKLESFANHKTTSAFETSQLNIACALTDTFSEEGASSMTGVPVIEGIQEIELAILDSTPFNASFRTSIVCAWILNFN